ncbi:hypothetical protein [Paraliobacillus sp. PM-2]|uniref:hypothetical protein n=1 Tax=Paraliobacillus sp. PM-2 TaxID=1462524 RepID=UPI00159ED96F|nr:hypothetical protein [Paraliobacillus sp. PM-2]
MFIDTLKNTFTDYDVVRNSEHNVEDVYNLVKENKYFLENTQSQDISLQECYEDITDLPPGKDISSKTYISFYQNNKCACVIDFIMNYPVIDTGYIGLFIIATNMHGKETGSLK